ncbi:hypothetical protein ABIB89_007539 [Bradyrhizobium sp. JR3.12]
MLAQSEMTTIQSRTSVHCTSQERWPAIGTTPETSQIGPSGLFAFALAREPDQGVLIVSHDGACIRTADEMAAVVGSNLTI